MDSYKQKYKDALERARQFSETPYLEDSAGIVEYIFPELKESEDERIRKGLIKAVSGTLGGNTLFGTDVTREEALAWLEKQGEINTDNLGQLALGSVATSIMNYIDEHALKGKMCLSNMECEKLDNAIRNADWMTVYKYMRKKFEKQGGNLVENGYTNNKDIIKYADNYSHAIWHKLMDNFKNIKDYHIGCNDVSDIVLNAIIDAYNWLEKQSKPKWSDEDEENLQHCCGAIHAADYYTLEDKEEMEKWLKSLKQRMEV